MALRLAAEEGLSRSGKACKGRGVEEVFGEGDMASMRIRKLRIGEATEPPFCTVCVACMIHVTLSFPLYPVSLFLPPTPFLLHPPSLVPFHVVVAAVPCLTLN